MIVIHNQELYCSDCAVKGASKVVGLLDNSHTETNSVKGFICPDCGKKWRVIKDDIR